MILTGFKLKEFFRNMDLLSKQDLLKQKIWTDDFRVLDQYLIKGKKFSLDKFNHNK